MIRPYLDSDLEDVLFLLELNTPKYFHVAEKEDLRQYLLNEKEEYFVVELNGEVVAAGGINYNVDSQYIARISWDVVAPKMQGKGIGKDLLIYRVNQIKSSERYSKIVVRTSQLTFQFYEKFGFVLKTINRGFWAKGLDLYLMEINLK